MRPGDIFLSQQIKQRLLEFDEAIQPLPGIKNTLNLNCFIEQIIDSIRRIKYVTTIRDKQLSHFYIDPFNTYFDPLKAASWYRQKGNINEAFWLIFLVTHCGRNKRTGWNLVKELYKDNSNNKTWDWKNLTSNFNLYRNWLQENSNRIKNNSKFGNHRKYQSLDAFSPVGTGSAIGSYIEWVGPDMNHQTLINSAKKEIGNNPRALFDFLYNTMKEVISFGRTAKFDYLTMIGKMGLANIEPGSTYMNGSTGPKSGARLLFFGNIKANINEMELNNLLNQLEAHLNIYYGMQVLEDALCNWQKNPSTYVYFRG